MARLPRIVIPECPHHITQRGNRRQQTFFCREDYIAYKNIMAQSCHRYGLKVLAYCLMPNHVHLIAIPKSEKDLSFAIGEAHELYTKQTNYRQGWRGHLWQGRFFSVPMDDEYTERCIQYVELNPVRANLCLHPEDYEWSSAKAHLIGADDSLLARDNEQLSTLNWQALLKKETCEREFAEIRNNSRTGRPLGSKSFIERLEKLTNLPLLPQKRGPKFKIDPSINNI